ncbi:hypothetical protein L7F22_067575 [Adiantum nelumboides]|nr:hypothetical protein [Adiantum nelumboides]
MEEQSLPSGHVLRQLLEVLQKLTVCLHNNEAQLEASGSKIATSKDKYAVRSDLPQKGTASLEDAADFKVIDCAGQGSPSLQLKNGFLKDSQFSSCTSHSVKERKLFAVTCWKWRWVVAASSLQALSKENKMLKSVSYDKRGSVQQSSFISCLEKFQATLINQDSKTTQEPSLDLQAPVSFDKLFVLLTSIWKLSSQSAHQEKETFCKGKQLDHLLRITTRWMQRALKKRQLERVITHWLRYLLQSWKDKFKLQSNAVLPLKQINYQILSPKYASNSAPHVQNSTSLKTRDAEKLLIRTSKGPQNLSKDADITKGQALLTLQESLHKRLEDLEASIMKEASHWHQQHVGKGDKESTSTNLVWVLYSELERSFSEARNQIMTHFGVFNKMPLCYVMETKSIASAFSPKPLTQRKVGSCKKPAERHSSVQAIARKRKQIFI